MTEFNLKSAPKGWMFPFSKKEVRAFVQKLEVDFDEVNFKGTTKPSEFIEDTKWIWMGILTSKRDNTNWIFTLEVYSLKEEYVVPWKEDIKNILFEEMEKWIREKTDLPHTAPEKPTQLYLKYVIKRGKVESSCWEVE